MPDFRLTDDEASALEAYLRANTTADWTDGIRFPEGDATQGRELVKQLRCMNCHDLAPTLARGELNLARTLIGQYDAPNVSGSIELDPHEENGCLAPWGPPNMSSPRYFIDEIQRSQLHFAVRRSRHMSRSLSPADEAQRLYTALRCGACHTRDNQPSLLPTILADESQLGHASESIPSLTWAGDRLHAAWMEKFIAGRIPDRPRPYLKARMPAFPAYARSLAAGFAAQHGAAPDAGSTGGPTAPAGVAQPGGDLLATGYQLTRKDGGLDCRQCHAVGRQEPLGDARTRIAHGINFVQIPQRMREDFYRRFILDPARYEPNTKMPKLSEGQTTHLQHIFGGDAARQFDAIWQYLQTLGDDEP
jgi:hypothetical protein